MIDELDKATRLVVDAHLRPVLGTSFQPTGFANLGAAEFQRPGEPRSLLVESVQSLANHFEAFGFDSTAREPIELLVDLPWIDVSSPGGEHLTSSREEPHRLAAAYVRDAHIDGEKGAGWLIARLGLKPKSPLNWLSIYSAIFQLDPLCLLHGVYFSTTDFHGNPKVRRALAAVIEAHDVSQVVSGGLKRDDVQFGVKGRAQGTREGYGFVPFGRVEYTARDILLSAVLDLEQIRGYGLPAPATRLLELLGMWELVSLLDAPMRLRTACDLEVTTFDVRRPAGFVLPARAELEAAIRAVEPDFDRPGATEAIWSPPKGASDKAA